MMEDMQIPVLMSSDKLTQPIVAPVQDNLLAKKAYAVGDLFIYNNGLYKVTTAIASGGAITIGTNATPSPSVAEELGSRINSRFTVVKGTLPSTHNTTAQVAAFPTGFTADNCIIIGFVTLSGNGNYYSFQGDYTSTISLFTTSGVGIRAIITSSTSTYLGQPITVVLMKVD